MSIEASICRVRDWAAESPNGFLADTYLSLAEELLASERAEGRLSATAAAEIRRDLNDAVAIVQEADEPAEAELDPLEKLRRA